MAKASRAGSPGLKSAGVYKQACDSCEKRPLPRWLSKLGLLFACKLVGLRGCLVYQAGKLNLCVGIGTSVVCEMYGGNRDGILHGRNLTDTVRQKIFALAVKCGGIFKFLVSSSFRHLLLRVLVGKVIDGNRREF